MSKFCVILYGPPGSGKGTQANLIANRFGLIHLDTGSFIEATLYDPANKNNPVIKKQKKLFESGALVDPKWVLKIIKDKTKRIHAAGFGIVYSGSPRTVYEALGDRHTEGLFTLLTNLYGRKNINVFSIDIPPAESIRRNRSRLIEPLLNIPIMGTLGSIKISPLTGAKLVRRKAIDTPAVIKNRLEEYQSRTAPILSELKHNNFKVNKIDGTPLPYKVFAAILKHLK